MSDQEQHQIIGETVVKSGVAKRKLASLEDRANNYAEALMVVSEQLLSKIVKKESTSPYDSSPPYNYERLQRALRMSPTVEQVNTIVSEIETTRRELDELVGRLRDMGV